MTVMTMPQIVSASDLDRSRHTEPFPRLLDVRTPGEFETVHIPGAYNVPLDQLGEHARDLQTHVHAPVVLVCQSGRRARKAGAALREAGMDNLHVLDGGVNGWVAAGLPVTRGVERMSLERQVRITAGALVAVGGALAMLANPLFALVPVAVGSGLVIAGATNTCAMAMALARLPYNRPATCDVGDMVARIKTGAAPVAPA